MSISPEQNESFISAEAMDIMNADLFTLGQLVQNTTSEHQSREFEWLYSKELVLEDGSVINIDYTEPESSTHAYFVAFKYLNDDGGSSILRFQWDSKDPEEKKMQIVTEINPQTTHKSARARTTFNEEDLNKIRWLLTLATENVEA